MTVYDFRQQLAIGQDGEAQLDALFGQWFSITPATMAEQRCGIDRWFVRQQDSVEGEAGERFAVEYKTDFRAAETGKAFVEMVTIHHDERLVKGWAYSSQSRWLVYYVPQQQRAHVVAFMELRRALHARWKWKYRMAHVANVSWDTWGLLVELSELARVAHRTLHVN